MSAAAIEKREDRQVFHAQAEGKDTGTLAAFALSHGLGM
jgi:hypothetical protein